MNSLPDPDILFRKLAAAHRAGRLAHAYLLLGPQAPAADLAARLAALLYCRDPAPAGPCGRCPGCRQAADRRHPALLWLEPHKRGRTLTVEQIHEARRHVLQTSPSGDWKTVVLAGADRLNTVAANTLLKVLEEPPPDCLFLLLTDIPEALLDTVRSRCQPLVLPGAESETAGEWAALADDVLGLAGTGVLPAMVRSRRIAEALAARRTEIEKEEKALLKEREREERLEGGLREEAEEVAEARTVARIRLAALGVLAALQRPCRDTLRLLGGAPAPADAPDALAARLARGLTVAGVLRNLRLLEEAKRRLGENMNLDWVFQRLFAEWAVPEESP